LNTLERHTYILNGSIANILYIGDKLVKNEIEVASRLLASSNGKLERVSLNFSDKVTKSTLAKLSKSKIQINTHQGSMEFQILSGYTINNDFITLDINPQYLKLVTGE
jgi:hypothetical protein